MDKKNNLYSLSKQNAISALKKINPASNEDVINIIDTILQCYVQPDVRNENGIPKVDKQTNQSNEVSFLIEELKSFIDGLKNN